MNIATLVFMCAPFVSSDTMLAIVEHESRGDPWAIGVNTNHKFTAARNYESAVAEAKRLIAAGAVIDMGLMQINSKTMNGLGLTVEQVFDPCTNIYAGGVVLTRNYIAARKKTSGDKQALHAALSAYNTGSFSRGINNGYVDCVLQKAGVNGYQCRPKRKK